MINLPRVKAIATQAAKDEIAKVGTGVDNVARTGVQEVNSRLDETAYNCKSNNTDDTIYIQSILDKAKEGSKVIFPQKEYNISDCLYLKCNNIEVDFCNSTINWTNTTKVVNSDITRGMINIRGNETNIDTRITNYATVINKVFNGKWSVQNPTGFNVGDYVFIEIKGGLLENNTSTDYKPSVRTVAKIVYINGNDIYTDYHTPFDMTNTDYNQSICHINKIEPLKNIVIRNLNFKDVVPWTNYNDSYGQDRDKIVAGVSSYYCANLKIENVTGEGFKFPLVWCIYTHNYNIKNIEGCNPTYIGAGEGYVLNLKGSIFGNIEHILGQNCRHIIDFSYASFAFVKDVKDKSKRYSGYNGGASIDLHGICEHDITFVDCTGEMQFGNGFDSFPMLMKNITLDKCSIKTDCCNVENLEFTNSNIIFDGMYSYSSNGIQTVKFNNCKIKWQKEFNITGSKRRVDMFNKIEFVDCYITGYEYNLSLIKTDIRVKNINDFTLKDCVINFSNTIQKLIFENVDYIDSNSSFIGVILEFVKSNSSMYYKFNDSIFKISNSDLVFTATQRDLLRMKNLVNCSGEISLKNVLIDTDGTGASPYIQLNLVDITSGNIRLNLTNAQFKCPNQSTSSLIINGYNSGIVKINGSNVFLDSNIVNYKDMQKILYNCCVENDGFYVKSGMKIIGDGTSILNLVDNISNDLFQIRKSSLGFEIVPYINGTKQNSILIASQNGDYIELGAKAIQLRNTGTSVLPTPKKGAMVYDATTDTYKGSTDGATWNKTF